MADLGQVVRCPECREELGDQSLVTRTGTGYRGPEAGDWSICAYCGTPLKYELDFLGLRLRKATEEEVAALAPENPMLEVRRVILANQEKLLALRAKRRA